MRHRHIQDSQQSQRSSVGDGRAAAPAVAAHASASSTSWGYAAATHDQSIISIAAAVAAPPGGQLMTQALSSPALSVWKQKTSSVTAGTVDKGFGVYAGLEDRVTEMRLFLDRRTGESRYTTVT